MSIITELKLCLWPKKILVLEFRIILIDCCPVSVIAIQVMGYEGRNWGIF